MCRCSLRVCEFVHLGRPLRLSVPSRRNRRSGGKPSLITRLLEDYTDDMRPAELGIATLAHAVNAVVADDKPADLNTLESVAAMMPTILRVVTEDLKKPTTVLYTINHGIDRLAGSTLNFYDACNAYTSMQTFLVAGLRSKDWIARSTCLGGVIRLHRSLIDEVLTLSA